MEVICVKALDPIALQSVGQISNIDALGYLMLQPQVSSQTCALQSTVLYHASQEISRSCCGGPGNCSFDGW